MKNKDDGKKKTTPKKSSIKKLKPEIKKPKSADVKVTPYREIMLSDGHGFFIKTTCGMTSDDRVQVTQYREHSDPEGMKFVCTEPTYFENKNEFLDWLVEMLKKNFDEIPYITIKPIDSLEIKKQERETIDAMYG